MRHATGAYEARLTSISTQQLRDMIVRPPLPMTPEEAAARGWDAVDVVFVTGDAYVDHPSFAMALLGRLLESEGFRVAILSQPDWHSCEPGGTFGRPRLFFAVSAGNMDSMINHYTANRKVRNDDAYSPGGADRPAPRPGHAGLLPAGPRGVSRACRSSPAASRPACAAWPTTTTGATRSAARSCSTAKADLLVYGMGERPLAGDRSGGWPRARRSRDLRDMRGVAYRLGASETPPDRGHRSRCPATRKCRPTSGPSPR